MRKAPHNKPLIVCLWLTVALPYLVAPAFAQNSAPAPAPAQGPVDIQADTQEFSGDQIIARGNVRVIYKDSHVTAPLATLFRDAGGNPQKAIFTQHASLIQNDSKIDAESLTFEIANQKVVAEGHAHSEVTSTASTGTTAGGHPGAQTTSAKNPASPQTPTKMITDADRQEYDRSSGKFEATGHVKVVHGDILVYADRLKLVYGLDNQPETALFTGHVLANQGKNKTRSDLMTYSLVTRRLQATGHVKSTVIQEQHNDAKKKPVKAMMVSDSMAANAATVGSSEPQEETITILSDAQDYSRLTGRVSATGNVTVIDGDLICIGPNAVLTTNADGQAEKVYFLGRAQISQPDRRWIADNIVITVPDKIVTARGNSRAVILRQPAHPYSPPATQVAGRPYGNSLSASKVEPTR